MLDGELTFQLGDELFTAGPGALALAPGGVAHTLANLGDAPARYLLLCTPAGFEGYFARLAAQAAGEDPPSWALAPTPPVTTVGGQIGERDDVAAATPIAPATGRVNVLARSEQTGGRIAVMDNRVGAGFAGPRLHHHDFDELFWVLDGELTFQLGDELLTCRAGELAFAPRGVHHTFANHSERRGAHADRLHACRVRTPLRADRGGPGGRRRARVGARARTAGHDRRTADRSRGTVVSPGRLSPRARKAVLTLHVSVSVALIGVTASVLILALTAAGAERAGDAHALYSSAQTLRLRAGDPLQPDRLWPPASCSGSGRAGAC